MYQVLIADDEALIRDGLKCIMDWESMGFSICGEASNGEDALKAIISGQPDLVLLDIRMPKMLRILRFQIRTGSHPLWCRLLSHQADR